MSKIDITLYVHMWIPLATKTFCLKHFSNALSTFEFLHSNVNFWISPTHCQLLNFSNALSTFEFLQSTVNFWISLTHCQLLNFSNALSIFEFLQSTVNFWISPTHCQLLNFSKALSTFDKHWKRQNIQNMSKKQVQVKKVTFLLVLLWRILNFIKLSFKKSYS